MIGDVVKETCQACGRCYPTEPKGRTRGSLRLDPRRPISPRSIYA